MATNVVSAIIPYLYQAISIPNAINMFLMDTDTDQEQFIDFCNKLTYFQSLLIDEQQVTHPKDLDDLYEGICTNFPSLKFDFISRRKSFLKFCSKCSLFCETGKPIEKVRDMKGCRIIIYDDDPKSGTDKCYSLLEYVIKYFTRLKKYQLCEAEPMMKTAGFNSAEFPDIYVPETSKVPYNYQKFVKDYIFHPKINFGYQSLHVILFDTIGNPIEIQIRTHLMDLHAESGPASHKVYDKVRYGDDNFMKLFDVTSIHMPGFLLDNNGNIIKDTAGLVKSKTLFERSRLF